MEATKGPMRQLKKYSAKAIWFDKANAKLINDIIIWPIREYFNFVSTPKGIMEKILKNAITVLIINGNTAADSLVQSPVRTAQEEIHITKPIIVPMQKNTIKQRP